MQLISFIDFADLQRLANGYTMTDQLATTVKEYLALIGITYVSPFACIGVLPDNAQVRAGHPLHIYGDTPLLLRHTVASDLRLTCESDVQTSAKNSLDHSKQEHRLRPHPKFTDLGDASFTEKLAHAQSLASVWDDRNYPEVRIYRGLTWADIEDRCAERLKKTTLDIDGFLGPNRR
jgi:hypothetical protein